MIDQIREKFRRGLVEYSLHATRQVVAREISHDEVTQTVLAGEVIEDYSNDKYGPSCLILGRTTNGRVLHAQCSYPSRPLIKVITAYDPDLAEWDENFRKRKAK